MGLDDLIKKVGKSVEDFRIGLREKTTSLDRWLLPGIVSTTITLDSLDLPEKANLWAIEHENEIRNFGGSVGYSFMENFFPYLSSGFGTAFVGIAAGIALHKHYTRNLHSYFPPEKRKKGKKSPLRKTYKKFIDLITKNRLVNNKVVLPVLAGAGVIEYNV